jgi:hypothetical protein
MERLPMFMDWQNQYCENDDTTENNLHQNPNVILHRNRKINPKIHMEG